MSLASSNHAAQQHATDLHAKLSQLLSQPLAAAGSQEAAAAVSDLKALAITNAQLARDIASNKHANSNIEEVEELQEACSKREQLLDDLLQLLDSSSQTLRAQLDDCHKLLATPPCMEDPETIVRYSHTLRHGFAPLGTTQGLWQVPPAPQVSTMLHSTLRHYARELEEQQEQEQLASVEAVQQQQQEQEAALAQQQQNVQQPPPQQQQQVGPTAIEFALNADLEDDRMVTTEEESDYSQDDYSDD